jgi:hypothetical protein
MLADNLMPNGRLTIFVELKSLAKNARVVQIIKKELAFSAYEQSGGDDIRPSENISVAN